MFNSVVLDVVIGLVLIYLLYSLLVSIVGEMISSRLRIRANMLKKTIGFMLLDDVSVIPEPTRIKRIWSYIKRKLKYFKFGTHPDFKYSLAEYFYNYPSIKYLGKNEYKNLPSYISQENFSETLFNILREKGTGTDDMTKIDFCLRYNTLNIDNETKKHITNLFKTADNNPNAFKISLQKWFNDTMDRLNGWYKRRMQFILFWFGFVIAVSFNVDSSKIARMLSKDKDARNKMVQMATSLAKDSSRYQNFIIANGDTLLSQAFIDSGYAHISKDIKDANLILGLGWKFDKLKKKYQYCLDQKKDSAVIKKIDSKIKKLIDANNIISIASLNKKTRIHTDSIYNNRIKKYNNEVVKAEITFKLTLKDKNIDSLKKADSTINTKIKFYNDRISVQTSLVAVYTDLLSKLKTNQDSFYQEINSFVGNRFANIDSISYKNSKNYLIKGQRNYYVHEKLFFVISNIFSSWSRLLGFVITALALSLGAPFWFDLLKKLVSIRSSGVKPEEKASAQNPDAVLPPKPQPVVNPKVSVMTPKLSDAEQLLADFTEKLKNAPGVIGIGLEFDNQNLNGLLVVHVASFSIKETLKDIHGQKQKLPNGFQLPVKYYSHQPNSTQVAFVGGEISNRTLYNGHGTLSCFLNKSGSTKTYLLSCWHVLKDNDNWGTAPVTKDIIDTSKNKIGIIVDGCLTDSIDIGIAECLDPSIENNTGIQMKSQFRRITAYDSLINTEVTLFGKVCGLQKAQIFHHQINTSLNYSNQERFMYDLFSISIIDREKDTFTSPTKPGDSGALVVEGKTQTPLGIIIGGNNEFSYGIKFSNAFSVDSIFKDYTLKI